MMQVLRDKAQGWIAWVIVGLVGLTFVLYGAGSVFDRGTGASQVVATVNGQKILGGELEGVYQRFMQQTGSQLRNVDSNEVKKELLDSLIQQKALLEATEKMGMSVSPQRVFATLGGLPFLQVDDQFSQEAYVQFLNKNHFTDTEFRKLLQDALVREQLQQSIIPSSFVLANDIQDLAKFMYQTRDFRFVTIAREPFVNAAQVSDEAIKQYYDNHLSEFMTDETLALEYIHLSLANLVDKIQPTDEELQQYYQDNAAHFSEPASVHIAHILISLPKDADEKATKEANTKVEEIQKRLKAGESFETLAKEFSDDKESAKVGGDLAWLTPGEMFPDFEKAAFALDKTGQVSEPLKTQYGIHIIKLLERKDEKLKPFADVKKEVIAQYKRQAAEEQFINLADELNGLAYDYPDSLAQANDKLKLPIQKTEEFTKAQGPKETLLQNPQVFTAAWSANVKENKNNSDLIKVDDQNYIVVRAASYTPAKQKSLEDSKASIKALLIAKESDEKVKEKAEKLLADLKKADEGQMSSIMGDLVWQEKQDVKRNVKDTQHQPIVQAAFTLPRNSEKERSIKAVPLPNGDYALVWVTAVKDGEPSSLSEEEKETYQAQLSKHMGELEFALYASYVYKEAKVKIK
ncbi:SurA N-terminal domain-containing protein [Candidatus Berkiella aquae]|uniref:Periplasmic chaperone PpiD n=1 Tax=Candidatus Berkiella aquae TaxID=295108 RepID=A0A0Q9YII9_9GAMM|nr:SurA N-terminal domain-containing protein [Candidatus Berkiella aquae]MCS5711723.1 SurA N-terminal domain-containing protein [Candidatus Berkiella aquae]